MERSPELKRALEEDAAFYFPHIFGNIIDAIDTYVSLYTRKSKDEYLQEIQEGKSRFYDELDKFKKSDYTPKGRINPKSIEKLYEFQDLDWSIDKIIEEIKSYMNSLYPKK